MAECCAARTTAAATVRTLEQCRGLDQVQHSSVATRRVASSAERLRDAKAPELCLRTGDQLRHCPNDGVTEMLRTILDASA